MTPPAFTVFVTDPNGPETHLQRAARLAARERDVRVGLPVILDGGQAAFLPLAYTGKASNSIDEATRLRRLLVDPHTRVLGEPAIWSNFQTVSKQQLQRGESLGFPLILLILLAGFGTVAAAVAPVALGAVAVFLSGAVIYWLSRSFAISVYVTNMASMIGIGVAVDYSLFIVSRFRRELHDGSTQDEALRRAMASSGTAVVFSGATVAVSLAALFAIDVNALRSMAVGAIVVVCISVLASVTLLPALLAAAGTRIDRFRLRLPWNTGEDGSDALWARWANAVMRRPVAASLAGAAAMLVLASPLLAMKTFNRGLNELPANAEVSMATERAQAIAGAGFARRCTSSRRAPAGRSRGASRQSPASRPSASRCAARTDALAARRPAQRAARVAACARRRASHRAHRRAAARSSAARRSSISTCSTRSSAASGRCSSSSSRRVTSCCSCCCGASCCR